MSFALIAATLEASQAAPAPAADPPPAAQREKVVSRPDVVSAAVSARAQGSRVEVESLRDETSSTWANPDGTMTTEAHAAPIRFKDTGGAWRDIDLNLQKGLDGTVAPRGHKNGLTLGKRNGAAGQVFAFADSGAGRQVEWVSPWKLPEPMLDGTKATYADVEPGVDLVLDARRDGFENDFVVKQRPSAAPVWRIPLRTKGLTAKQLADGSIEFVDAKNVAHSRIPVGYMWDSAMTGEQDKKPVKVTVEQASPGKATLVIAPDAAWFMDPARQFPVTVDPTYVSGTTKAGFDTWIRSGVTTDQSASTDLQVGYDGSFWARSFLNFTTAQFAGKDILSANISLWQHSSLSCTPTSMSVRSSTPATTDSRWTNQPTIGASYGTVSSAKGFSASCPGGRITVPMTGLAQAWSTASYPVGGLALTATNEQDATTYKKFYSTAGIADPFITLTWNRRPATPAVPTFVSGVAYAPPGGSSALYSPYLNPWISTKGTDADGNTVKYIAEFHNSTTVSSTSLKATCTTGTFASGSTAGCQPSTNLPDNTTIYARAKTNDGRLDSTWSAWSTIRIGGQQPAAPTISCPSPYAINSWQDTTPTADVVCTVTATGTGFNAPGYIRVTVDNRPVATNFTGGAAGQIKITPSSDPAIAKTTVTIKKDTAGLHRITAQAETPAGRLTSASYSFGWGSSTLTSPGASPRTTTTGTIKIEASGPPKGQFETTPTAKIRWRTSGYGSSAYDTIGWNIDDTVLAVKDNGSAGVTVSTEWDTKNAKVDGQLDADPSTPAIEPTELNGRLPVLLDVQVCFTYASSTQCTWSQSPNTTVQRIPHAFSDGFPTAEAGPGDVALWTGEFNTEANDISVAGYTGELTISRSHSTYAGEPNSVNDVFGPGWVAEFDGVDVGAAGRQVIDSSHVDGTIALVDGDGTSLVFASPDGKRRTGSTFTNGIWRPADETTDTGGSKLSVTGSGTSTTISYTDDDGTVTTWTAAVAPAPSTDTLFRPAGIAEPGVASKTTYSYDGTGRVSRILAPVPPGVTCPAFDASKPAGGLADTNAGCRALRFVYTTIGGQIRLSGAYLDTFNPGKAGGAGMDSIMVAAYTYETGGAVRLLKVTDPRSNLTAEYSYNAANHLTGIKPAGQIAYQLTYITENQREKLDSVSRDRPIGDTAGGTAVLDKFVYGVPLTGDGLPDMSATSTGRWNQKSTPTTGFAVFSADHPLSAAPTSEDWQHAELLYTDASGYTVNTASYGAGAWQSTATEYNDQGNVIRELDERALRRIIDDQVPSGASVDQLATLTVYNKDVLGADQTTVVTPAGTLVTDTYGPARWVSLKNGTPGLVRPHTHTDFDQGAPNGGINPETNLPYRLVTTETTSAFDPAAGSDEIISRTLTDYDPPVEGDANGWALGQAGKTITDANPTGPREETTGDIAAVTRYDAEGRVIETRQPQSTGSSAGTTKTVYYSAGTASPAECGGKPEWAGLVCQTAPAGAPTSGPSLPTRRTTGYSYLLAPTTVIETSGVVTRTSSTAYLLDGRTSTSKTAVVGLAGSTPNTEKTTMYDPATGLPTSLTAKSADGTTTTVTTAYDSWGRKTSYQPAGQQPTITTYNAAGDIATITDPQTTTVYSYDGMDAEGRIERRGLLTKVVVTTGGATWTSTGAYDAASSLTIQKLPGGITQTQDFDNAGEKTGLRYTGQVTTLNDDGSTSVNPNGGWMSWSATNDVTGRTAREWTPDGAAFAGSIGDAQPYDRAYSYDTASRLTQVRDRTAPTGADITTDPEAMPCQTRTYQYDGNGNRLTKLTSDVANGPCATSGGTAQNRTFDTADRPSAYTYDALGRTSSITAADAPNPAGGQISFSYYDNDAVRSTTQGSATTSYELDAADRRSTETTTAAGVPAIQTTRYYNDESDNPAWIVKDGKVQTYAELIGSDLTLTTDGGDAELAISNPHGDIVTTIALAPGALADGITGWNNFDEFGNPGTSNNASTGALAYGWLGASQRATTPSGLLLMGSRVYNPTSGTFGSVDPVRGGNVNAYTYPVDPVNNYDISGNRKTEERGTKLATKKQVKKVKAKVKKARSKYKRVMREYRSMLKRGKHIGPRCILRIIVMIAVWVGIVAGMALIPLTGPLVPWLWVAAVSAWIAWIAPIMDMADACTAPTGGRD